MSTALPVSIPRPPPRAGASASRAPSGPARIHSAWKARSARPTAAGRHAPRDQVRAANRSSGSGVSARNRSAAAESRIQRERLRLNLGERERVARGLTSGAKQEDLKAVGRSARGPSARPPSGYGRKRRHRPTAFKSSCLAPDVRPRATRSRSPRLSLRRSRWMRLSPPPTGFSPTRPEPKLPISGSDLIARGVAAGRPVGRALRAFQALWIRAGFPKEPETMTRLLEEAVAEFDMGGAVDTGGA